jgi:LacI family transcriptional regulator
VRLLDVANAAGVSIATASRALAGQPGVSPELADHVRAVATSLGYIVNQHARALAGGTSSSLGLLVHEIGDPYFAEIASGVLDRAGAGQMIVQICHTGRDPGVELEQVRLLIAHRVGTIVIAGSGHVDSAAVRPLRDELAGFVATGGRVTVVGRHHLSVDAVVPDNRAGGHTIGAHVAHLGHRRIAIASGPRWLTTVEDRLAGMFEAFREAGLDIAELPFVEAEFNVDGGYAAADRILAEHPEATVIVALNDAMAIGVLNRLREDAVPVPERISVTGFDDVVVAASLAPGLTTIRLPMADFGRIAVELALDAPATRPRRRRTGHALVVRASTGPPRHP